MRRSILFMFALVSAGTLAFCGQAKAEVSDVPFSGNIAPKCTFTNVLPGTLENVSNPRILYTNTWGFVNIFCNTPAMLSVADPVNNGSTGATSFDSFYGAGIFRQQAASFSPGAASFGSTAPLNIPPSANNTIQVGMRGDTSASAVQSGNYNFLVTLTSTP